MTPTRQRPDGTEAQVETADRIASKCETHISFSSPTRRFPLSISGLCAIALAACAMLPAQAKEKIVGVPGWTSGSQTYLRARPSADMPAVAKVPRHTRLYVWGKFDGWYRVETPDGKFGWVFHPYVNAPSIDKVAELSHRKAKSASNRTADQKLYGDAETMRNYRETYGHLVSEPDEKPRLATSRQRPLVTRVSSTRSTRNNVKLSRKVTTVTTTKTVAPKVVAVRVSAPRVSAPRVVKTRNVEIFTKKVESPESIKARETKAALLAQQAKANRQARLARAQNEAKVQQIALQEREDSRLNAQKYASQQRAIAEQKRLANAQAQAKIDAAAQESRRQSRVARLQRERQARAARYQKRLVTLQANRRARTARNLARVATIQKREKERAKLATLQQGAPTSSTRSSSIAVSPSDVALRPISPQELQKAREQYLNSGRRATSSDAASNTSSTSSPLNKQSDRVSGFEQSSYETKYEVRGKITVTPPGQVTTNVSANVPQGLTLSLGASPAKVVSVRKVVAVTSTKSTKKQAFRVAGRALTSRGGSPMMRAGIRGGSPRDYAHYRAQGSLFGQTMAKQALTYRGRPYIMGAASPSRGFDCSGLIYFLLRQRGYNPPRTAAGLSHYGNAVSRNDLQPGDILLFANTYKRGISHAGIYMGNGKFVHAANSKRGVATNSLSERYYSGKYWGARRVK